MKKKASNKIRLVKASDDSVLVQILKLKPGAVGFKAHAELLKAGYYAINFGCLQREVTNRKINIELEFLRKIKVI